MKINLVMKMEQENKLPDRKRLRLKDFDYSTSGAYFITVCTRGRKNILSRIVGGDVLDAPKNVELLPYGEIAKKYINQLNDFYDDIKVDRYVVMPNHIHIILFVFENGASRTSPPTTKQHSIVSRFVSTYKRFCNKEYGENIWQRGFYDHVIRGREDYEEIVRYIYDNPARWYYDELYVEE